MSTSALPPAARTRKRLKHEHETTTTHIGEASSPSSASSSAPSTASSNLPSDSDKDITEPSSADSNDFVGQLIAKPGSPSIGNDFLTAHHILGDYVRKHEIPRKVFHSSIGFITLYLYTQGVQKEIFPLPLTIGFFVILIFDLIRFRSRRFNYLYCQVLGFLMREKEVKSFNGVLWYLLGLDIAFTFFPKDIAVLAVLLLSWSDTAASTCGRQWGHLTPKIARNKSLAGSIAAFLVGLGSSYLLYGYFIPSYPQFNAPLSVHWSPETSRLNIHILSFLMGLVAAVSEGIDIFNWDDNFTIPVFSSIFAYGVISFFHI